MTEKIGTYHEKHDWFYQTKEWKALRAARFAYASGLCERCRQRGVVKEGKEVHHIIPIEVNWEKRLDFENVILLCSECHNEQHERISPLQKFNRIWEDLQNGGTYTDNKPG